MNGNQLAFTLRELVDEAYANGPYFDGNLEVWLTVGGDGANHTEKAASVRVDGKRIIIEAEGVG